MRTFDWHAWSGLTCALLIAAAPVRAQPATSTLETETNANDASAAGALYQRLASILSQPGGLTTHSVGERAMHTSFAAEAEAHAAAGARFELELAKRTWLPRLDLSARYARLSPYEQNPIGPFVAAPGTDSGPLPAGAPLVAVSGAFPALVDQYLLRASLIVPVGDYLFRTTARVEAAGASKLAAELGERAARRNARLQAQLLYLNWARAQLQAVVAEQTLTQAQAHLQATRDSFELARANQADVLAAAARVASAGTMIDQLRSTTAQLEYQLKLSLHHPATATYAIGEDLTAALPEPASREELERTALANRPELAALAALEHATKYQHKLTRGDAYPRLDFFANGYYANPNPRFLPPESEWRATWDAGVELSWSPNDATTSGARAQRALAEADRLRAERRALIERIRTELDSARHELQHGVQQMQARAQRVRAAEEAYRVRRELFSLGRATALEVLNAETELLVAQLDWIDSHIDSRTAQLRLEHALGL